jgi:hypothetical protein
MCEKIFFTFRVASGKILSMSDSIKRIKDPLRRSKLIAPNIGDGAIPKQLRNVRTGRKSTDKLNTMQRRFVDNYVKTGRKGWSATQAGYSGGPNAASNMLKNPKIQAAIESRRAKMQQVVDEIFSVEAKEVLREIALIAFSNMGDFFKDWGQRQKTISIPGKDGKVQTITINENFVIPKSKSELSELQQRCIDEISLEESNKGKTFRFKIKDKLGALKLLGSYFGLFDGGGKRVDPNDTVAQLREAAARMDNLMPGGSRNNGVTSEDMPDYEEDPADSDDE